MSGIIEYFRGLSEGDRVRRFEDSRLSGEWFSIDGVSSMHETASVCRFYVGSETVIRIDICEYHSCDYWFCSERIDEYLRSLCSSDDIIRSEVSLVSSDESVCERVGNIRIIPGS